MSRFFAPRPAEIKRPVLEISGDALRMSLQTVLAGAEEHGGIEAYVEARRGRILVPA